MDRSWNLSTLQRLPNGSIDVHDDSARALELQELLDKSNKDLVASRERGSALNARVAELENELAGVRKELLKSEEFNSRHQRDIREVSVIDNHGRGTGLKFIHQRELVSRAGVSTVQGMKRRLVYRDRMSMFSL